MMERKLVQPSKLVVEGGCMMPSRFQDAHRLALSTSLLPQALEQPDRATGPSNIRPHMLHGTFLSSFYVCNSIPVYICLSYLALCITVSGIPLPPVPPDCQTSALFSALLCFMSFFLFCHTSYVLHVSLSQPKAPSLESHTLHTFGIIRGSSHYQGSAGNLAICLVESERLTYAPSC